MVKRFSFTSKRLTDLQSPEKGRCYHYDEKTAGLCLCVTKAGTKTFYLYKKIAGRPERVRLGKFPDLSIDQARKAAQKITGEIAEGNDPAAERRAQKEIPTFQDLYDHWLIYAKDQKKTWAEDVRLHDKFLKKWDGRRLPMIKRRDIQALHTKVGKENGKYQANRLLGTVKAMFAKAWEIGYQGANPGDGVKKFREEKRDRFLQPDELQPFFQALADEPNTDVRDCILMLLWTGARRGNVQSMQWEDVNLDLGIWRIPETKTGDPVVVPIVEPAAAILRERLRTASGSPWVFPAPKGKTGHIVEPKKIWAEIVKRAGLKNLRMHDLRRTLGSWQAMGGSSLQVIGKSLGHKQVKTTEIYARLQLDPVRESVDAATAAMIEAGKMGPDTEDNRTYGS